MESKNWCLQPKNIYVATKDCLLLFQAKIKENQCIEKSSQL